MKSSGVDAVVLPAGHSLAIGAELTFTWWEVPGKTQADLLSGSSAKSPKELTASEIFGHAKSSRFGPREFDQY